ncbi:MAG: gamma-butyrobetaine hydroxylase-like domain-containing protein [Sinimarinibacterium flocculans]|uniref:gamma-butyrobetaine hydroxylase-like domain-containing protein n=1 Tax=Sinimarinibacterium flocculans TaxID=985250 RepID=UPI003C64E01C
MGTSAPSLIRLHRKARVLEVAWADGTRFELPCEYLRVFSPSAELRGHGLPEPMLVGGKREVNITRVEPVGRYAVRLVFDDGHDSGIYSWDILRELGETQAANWARYLQRLEVHRMSRDSEVVKLSALVKTWTPPA